MKLIITSVLLAFMPSAFAASTTTTASIATASEWAQCGGIGFTGPTVCPAGWTCVYANAYHSQCLVVSTTSTSPTSTSTTSTSPTSTPKTSTKPKTTTTTTKPKTTTTTTKPKTTTTTTTAAATTSIITAPEWGQCGGVEWIGPTICPAGWTCVYENEYFSNCFQITTTSASPTSTSTTTTTTSTTSTSIITAPEYGQCGGVSWTGPTVCPAGWTCVWENEWYSNCFPGSTSSASAASNPTVTTTSTTGGYYR